MVRIPTPPVEAAIALSVIFLAWEIVKDDETQLAYRYPVMVSSSFGLLHGFGFAGALGEVGLPQHEVPLALLMFNVGVELGQLLFIAVILVIVYPSGRVMPTTSRTKSTPPRLRKRASISTASIRSACHCS